MPRTDVSMTAGEIATFIKQESSAVVTVNGAEGFVADVVAYKLSGDSIEFEAGDELLAALDQDPRICITVEYFTQYEKLRGVVVHGSGRLNMAGEVTVPITDDVVSFDFAKLSRKT